MDYIAKALNIPDLFVSKPNTSEQSASSTASPSDEMDSGKESTFGSALETMDRFLTSNENNLLVQSLISLESKTNISRRYLARAFLILLAGYFLFSNSVLDLVTHLLMYLYPSFRTYMMLKNDQLTKDDLIDILKFWMFVGFYSTFDFGLGFLIPFGSVVKLVFIIQCVLPRKSPTVEFAIAHCVTPVFRFLESNENIRHVNEYVTNLATNLKSSNSHTHQD